MLAALGGAVMGIGVGLAMAQRRQRSRAKKLKQAEARLRSTVVPLLERRAQQLGLTRERRTSVSEDPLSLSVHLATAILEVEDRHSLPWSDTVEASTEALRGVSGERRRDAG